ncbi:pimeloyl-ACP methyl ester carboxylesterase [Scopulibacillus daqui]|uniref:Pimeloyl-ACP methyl ester carboxylesterase n=1 Tax=Scopulibacillus daqui TaxID=1469162 RepID=A0ABS2Q0J1_9BACL|nr:alpha/beta hydrolase [Scopulibacillus daqui]MBM7645731.1 pimeloyl-ACP methyl ester carboxylesterase [Scopulibacillus daqui]
MTEYTKCINGVKIYYEKHGSPQQNQPVLVMVHGYLSSTFSFRTLIPYLKDKYQIYALDLPGFGQSEKSMTFVYSLENYAKLVIAFIDTMNIKKAVLIGHSMGGQICLNAAKKSPRLISKVVCLSASGYMGKVKRTIRFASYIPFISYYIKRYFEKKDAMKVFLDVVHNRDLIDESMKEGYLKPMRDINFYRSLLRLARHREGDMYSSEIKQIRQPVLLLWGKEDKVVPVSIGKRLNADLPASELRIYENTGHLLPEEKPEETAKDIDAFLNQRI